MSKLTDNNHFAIKAVRRVLSNSSSAAFVPQQSSGDLIWACMRVCVCFSEMVRMLCTWLQILDVRVDADFGVFFDLLGMNPSSCSSKHEPGIVPCKRRPHLILVRYWSDTYSLCAFGRPLPTRAGLCGCGSHPLLSSLLALHVCTNTITNGRMDNHLLRLRPQQV